MNTKKVFVVEDAPFMREALKALVVKSQLSLCGEAHNGKEAVEKILKAKPDIVIMDLVLPEKNGLQVAEEILKVLPNTKIIACSTESQDHVLIQAIDKGCVDFIKKPFEAQKVITTLQRVSQCLGRIQKQNRFNEGA